MRHRRWAITCSGVVSKLLWVSSWFSEARFQSWKLALPRLRSTNNTRTSSLWHLYFWWKKFDDNTLRAERTVSLLFEWQCESCVVQLCDHKTSCVCSHEVEMGSYSYVAKQVPAQPHNSFLEQKCLKVIVWFHSPEPFLNSVRTLSALCCQKMTKQRGLMKKVAVQSHSSDVHVTKDLSGKYNRGLRSISSLQRRPWHFPAQSACIFGKTCCVSAARCGGSFWQVYSLILFSIQGLQFALMCGLMAETALLSPQRLPSDTRQVNTSSHRQVLEVAQSAGMKRSICQEPKRIF